MKTIKKNFKTPVHLACGNDDLRPVMQNVFFDEGYAVATNAHLLVKQCLKLHGFTEEEIKVMNGKFLHRDEFKEVMRYDRVTVSEAGFACTKGGINVTFAFSDPGESKYPNYKAVIPSGKTVPMDSVSLNIFFMDLVNKISVNKSTRAAKFHFYGTGKAILITTAEEGLIEETILIMPVMTS